MEISKFTLSVSELASRLGIGRNIAYDLAHRSDFPSITIGHRILIPVAALQSWLEKEAGKVHEHL